MGNVVEFLQHSALKKAEVRVAIQAPQIHVRPVSIPIVPADEMHAVVSWSFKELTNLNIDEYVIRFSNNGIDTATNKQNVTAFGIEKTFLDQWLKFLSEVGVGTPSIAEPDIQSLANLVIYNNDLSGSNRYALIDIGRSQSQLAVISRSGIEFYRTFSGLGTHALAQEIGLELGISEEDAERRCMEATSKTLSKENAQMMDVINGFYAKLCVQAQYAIENYASTAPNFPISNILLAGGGARLVNLKDQIQETLHFPTDVINPFAKLDLGKFRGTDFDSYKSLYAVAVGLAL
jgi:type IV pilus assembly protein PilM